MLMYHRPKIQQDVLQLIALSFLEYHHFLIQSHSKFRYKYHKGCSDSTSSTLSSILSSTFFLGDQISEWCGFDTSWE